MTLRNRLESLTLALAIAVFRMFPVDFASWLMGLSWRIFAPLNPRHKRAMAHLEQAFPGMPETERRAIISGMWDNLGRVAAETFHIDRLLTQPERFEAITNKELETILTGGQGCIMVSLHTGNWEICVQPAVARGAVITGVYQALKNPEADKALQALRQDLYKGGLLSKGHKTARKILATLKGGGTVAIMGDLRETRGIKVPFFGRLAYATPIPASLARSCGVPIVLGRVVRKKGVTFRLEAEILRVPETGDRQADIETATARIHETFERWIREHPEQWMWIHKKWASAGASTDGTEQD